MFARTTTDDALCFKTVIYVVGHFLSHINYRKIKLQKKLRVDQNTRKESLLNQFRSKHTIIAAKCNCDLSFSRKKTRKVGETAPPFFFASQHHADEYSWSARLGDVR